MERRVFEMQGASAVYRTKTQRKELAQEIRNTSYAYRRAVEHNTYRQQVNRLGRMVEKMARLVALETQCSEAEKHLTRAAQELAAIATWTREG